MSPRSSAQKPSLELEGLNEFVSQKSTRPGQVSSFRPPREGRESSRYRFYFAGWLGLMFGPIPIGHLVLGLAGLYFKLR